MTYVSLLKNIPEILSQPTGIAALASLGIHGAIALIVPLMPVDSEQSQKSTLPKSVGILELSQADQNRLPQTPGTSQSPVALQPQLPVQPGFSFQPQLPMQPQQLPPNLDTQRATLPPLPPSLYRQQPLPPIVRPNIYRNPSNTTASLPERQPAATPPREELQFDNSGFNAADKKFTPSAPVFNADEIRVAVQPLPVNRLPQVNAAARPNNLPNTLPPVTATTPTPPTPQPSNNAAQVARNQALIARIQQTPQAGDELNLANESIPKWQQGSAPKTPELPLAPVNEPQTEQTLVAKLTSYEDLRAAIQQEYPGATQKAVIRETVATNKPSAEGTVSGFLVIDTDGKVLDIKFQDKSVSPELQVKAREYFNTKSPKADQQISSYPFNLRFENNGNTAETTPQQKPAAVKPAPTPAANVQPLPDFQIRTESPAPAPVVIPQTSSAEETNGEGSEKLIQRLRQSREQKQE
ncbi:MULTISPECIES: hypothetical protein [unclassified Anabaena]|uniref:hypothetical protein n=1 Tax=unclassified Anabaena TaxID=2619674 RepID=UPI0039C660D8